MKIKKHLIRCFIVIYVFLITTTGKGGGYGISGGTKSSVTGIGYKYEWLLTDGA